MTGREPLDDAVRAWVRSGPEVASAEFVERTLRPIPRMRQRRSWRIALERYMQPMLTIGGAAAVVVVLIVGLGILALRPGSGGSITPGGGPSPSASRPPRPSFTLTVGGGTGAGTYTSDPTANLSMCTHLADGSWRLLYVGGTPSVNLDMLVGAGADQPAGASRVAVEVDYGPGYVRFDPADLRGGDVAGRSSASVTVDAGAGATTFTIVAATPDTSTGTDGARIAVDLAVTCPT